MNNCNTLPESYHQTVYQNTLGTVKSRIRQAENRTPVVAVSVEAVGVDNAVLLDYFTSKVALEEPEIGSADLNIPIVNDCTDDALHLRMPAGSEDYDKEGYESDERGAIPTASPWWQAGTVLKCSDLGRIDVHRYECNNSDDADADEIEEASQADDGSTWNVESCISDNHDFHQKHPGVRVGSNCSEWPSYPRTEKYILPVVQSPGSVAYLPSVHCARDVVMYTQPQNDTSVTLFAGATVRL